MVRVVGINSFTHDGAVALIGSEQPVVLLEEERFTRRRHEDGFVFGGGAPDKALAAALAHGEPAVIAHARRVDHAASDHNLPQRRFLSFARSLDASFRRTRFIDHHSCHAANAYFLSQYSRAYVCTLDSQGDGVCATVSLAGDEGLERVADIPAGASICAVYSYATELLGLGRRREGSLMALAGLEEAPRRIHPFEWTGHTFRVHDVGPLERAASRAGESIVAKARLAADVQESFEETVEHMLLDLCHDRDIRTIAAAGGGFLNCSLVGRLGVCGRWDDIYVPPAAGDSGCALGAALATLEAPSKFACDHAYWGSSYTKNDVGELFAAWRLEARMVEPEDVAALIADGYVGGFFTGPMEFGPRALGHRSILGDPRRIVVRERLNKIKGRQPWRPVAPAVVHERGPDLFEMYQYSPYMTRCFTAKPACLAMAPVTVHTDGTARLQSVLPTADAFSRLVYSFYERTAVPLIANTSLNVAAPIVRTPQEAVAAFYTSELDFLYCEGYLLQKKTCSI